MNPPLPAVVHNTPVGISKHDRNVITRRSSDTVAMKQSQQDSGRINDILAKLEIENKIKEGAENLLQVFDTRKLKEGKEAYKQQVESQLDAANAKIQLLQLQLHEYGLTKSSLDVSQQDSDRSDDELDSGQESPTWSLGDILQSLETTSDQNSEYLVSRANDLVSLLQRHPLLKYDLAMSQVGDRIRALLLHTRSEVVAAGYRVARYAITDLESLQNVRNLYIDYLVVKSLTKDAKSQIERVQAIKLIRSFLDLPNGVEEIGIGIIRALIAVAEQSDDKLRNIALETLTEIFIQQPHNVAKGGGVRVLLQCIVDGPFELSVPVCMALTYVLDRPENRQLLRDGRDLEFLISAFTDFQIRGHVHTEKLVNSANVLVSALRSWSGLHAFSVDNFNILKKLVGCLNVKLPSLRDVLLDFFFKLFRIRQLSWSSSYLAGRRLTTFGRVDFEQEPNAQTPSDCRYVDHYTALLLQVFVKECGLISVLSDMLKEKDEEASNSRKAMLLVSEIMSMMERLLPNSDVASLILLPDLFNSATYRLSMENAKASGALFQIDRISRNLQKTDGLRRKGHESGAVNDAIGASSTFNSTASGLSAGTGSSTGGGIGGGISSSSSSGMVNGSIAANSSSTSLSTTNVTNNTATSGTGTAATSTAGSNSNDGSQHTNHQVKLKMGVQIDDASFKQLIMDTQVLNTKTYTKWNWDALSKLIQGPLLNPRRLEEAIKTTKFMKRLMSFYRPFKYRFSSIKRTKPNQKYVQVGKSLLNTMLCNPEGVKYLTENKLLRQIAECLAQLDPMSGITSPEPLFSSTRLQHTLSYGYFTLLGTLSADPNGMQMMERWRMFNMFYHLSELSSREDLITNFIISMDYRLPGHPRIILSKALTTGQKDVRLFATEYLRNLTRSEPNTQKWVIGLLVTQLYDPEVEVCRLAVEVLEEFCEDAENLEHFVKLQPSFGHLGDVGSPLLLRFLSTSNGFRYLKELDYVHKEMDNWIHGQNDFYVVQIEEYLESAHTTWIAPDSLLLKEEDRRTGIMPRHFYGELTLTEEGCQLLQSKGHFKTFANFIKQHKFEYKDKDTVTKLKGCLWAVGNIGANSLGAPFLEESGVISDISEIATDSKLCSLKGTAYFALGLVSSTQEGMEILDEMGWETVVNVMGQSRGVCLPKSLMSLFGQTLHTSQLPGNKSNGNESAGTGENHDNNGEDEETDFPQVHSDPIKRKIVSALSDLSNQILANEASRQLVKLESKYGSRFQSIDLFVETMGLMEKFRYKLPVRRFIFELFNTSALIERMAKRQKDQQRRARHLSDSTRADRM